MTITRSMGDVVAREIRRHRENQKLTVKQLAAECAKLGASQLTASALTNIERGQGESGPGKGGRPRAADAVVRRRRDVSYDELMVIARALGIPPVMLIFPVATGEEVEVLPGRQVSAWRAYKWFAGVEPFPELVIFGQATVDTEDVTAWQKGALPLIAHREHDRLVDGWNRAAVDATSHQWTAENALSDEVRAQYAVEADKAAQEARALEHKLADYRRFMRRHDVTPELLPPGLTHVDDLPPLKPSPVPAEDHSEAMWALLTRTLGADREALKAATTDADRAALRARVRAGEERLAWFEDEWRQRRAAMREQGIEPSRLPAAAAHIDA